MKYPSIHSGPRAQAGGNAPVSHSERPLMTESRGLRHAAELVPGRAAYRSLQVRTWGATQHSRRNTCYEALVAEFKNRYKISIRKWRSQMSGAAYELQYRDGRIKRLITAPRPRSPVSAAIFLHEVGHHAVGFHRYASRCLEEYYVWQWAFREMTARNIPVDDKVLRHYRRSMHHYVRIAKHRGEYIPHELHAFAHATAA